MSRTGKGAIIGSLVCGVLAWPVAGAILYHTEKLLPELAPSLASSAYRRRA